MSLNGVMALILLYITESLPRFQNFLLIVYHHYDINAICPTIQRLFGQDKRRQ